MSPRSGGQRATVKAMAGTPPSRNRDMDYSKHRLLAFLWIFFSVSYTLFFLYKYLSLSVFPLFVDISHNCIYTQRRPHLT